MTTTGILEQMQHDKVYDILIAITMPVDTLTDRLFPCSTLARILKGSAKDGAIKVRKKQATMLSMLIDYNRVLAGII